jgi:sensor histidine kinase YesM
VSRVQVSLIIFNKGVEDNNRRVLAWGLYDQQKLIDHATGLNFISLLSGEIREELRTVDVHTLDLWVEFIREQGFNRGVDFESYVIFRDSSSNYLSFLVDYDIYKLHASTMYPLRIRESEVDLLKIHAFVLNSLFLDYLRLSVAILACCFASTCLLVPFLLAWIYFLRQPGLRPLFAGRDFKRVVKQTRIMCNNPLSLLLIDTI